MSFDDGALEAAMAEPHTLTQDHRSEIKYKLREQALLFWLNQQICRLGSALYDTHRTKNPCIDVISYTVPNNHESQSLLYGAALICHPSADFPGGWRVLGRTGPCADVVTAYEGLLLDLQVETGRVMGTIQADRIFKANDTTIPDIETCAAISGRAQKSAINRPVTSKNAARGISSDDEDSEVDLKEEILREEFMPQKKTRKRIVLRVFGRELLRI